MGCSSTPKTATTETAEIEDISTAATVEESTAAETENATVAEADKATTTEADKSAATVEDKKKVQDAGTLVVGITDFEPMDYKDESGNWVGFDADMANEFAKSLGVEAKFVEIEWDNKALELDSGNIDCVWNGMTLTDEVLSAMDCSNPYCNNAQIVIVPADKADQYKTVESLSELNFAVEVGSAGEAQAQEHGLKYTSVSNQASALMEVAAGTSDAAIIDSLMAAAMVGEGTSYDNLTYTVGLNDEEYGVGFRKGSDLKDELNAFFKSTYADGSMKSVAEKYGVQASLIEQ
ncbi:MAG: transporter substrate-binding domain-containing protein [Eubacterium sp.]|nr:transporter substrate-binding domain-containing protein [Eubacterium sp.]